jgi:carboxymethylenebutenolidase
MTTISLTAADGHHFAAYEASPPGKPRGGLVVVQEIFGVNRHIRDVADGYAADGYHVLAPAIFDRAERGIELGYDKENVATGIALRQKISLEEMLSDIAACVAALKSAGKVGVVGYCLGGSLAWLAATRLAGVVAAVGYYGGMVARHLGETPKCPVMLHFGDEDGGIPIADVAAIRAAVDPKAVQVFTYAGAGHAFNRKGNHAYHEDSARLARDRSLAFLRKHLG